MKQQVQQAMRGRAARVRGMLAAATLCTAMVAAFFTAPVPAHAASRYEPVTANVPVEVSVKGDKPEKALTTTFTMVPAEGETVQPDKGSVTIEGEGEASFAVSFDEVGEHHYTVTQTTKDADNWTIDRKTVYDVTVYCLWEEDTDTLFTTVVMKNGQGLKDDTCVYENTYKAPKLPETGKTEKPKAEGAMPQTGDSSMLAVGAACVAGAVLVCGGVVLAKRRGERDAE